MVIELCVVETLLPPQRQGDTEISQRLLPLYEKGSKCLAACGEDIYFVA